MRKYFSLVFIILGTYIGAGCISGKEVVVYFANYTQFILMAILACIAIIFLFNFYLSFGKKYIIRDFADYNKVLFGRYSKIVDVLYLFCMLCMVGNMIAGLDIILYDIIPNTLIINIILVLIVYIVVSYEVKGLEIINTILLPFILLFILLTSLASIDIDTIYNTMQVSDFSLFKVIIYIFLNVFDISILLSQISDKYSKKVCRISSIICGVVIFLVILISALAYVSNNVLELEFPLLNISSNFGLKKLYYIVSIFAMLTTLISVVYIVYSYIGKYFSKFISVVIISSIGVIISLLGFTFIISYVYMAVGILGVILFIRSFYIYYFNTGNYKNNIVVFDK